MNATGTKVMAIVLAMRSGSREGRFACRVLGLLVCVPTACRYALSCAEMKTRTAYRVMMFANAAYLRRSYGEAFYRHFRAAADDKLRELIPRIPDLGDSVA